MCQRPNNNFLPEMLVDRVRHLTKYKSMLKQLVRLDRIIISVKQMFILLKFTCQINSEPQKTSICMTWYFEHWLLKKC